MTDWIAGTPRLTEAEKSARYRARHPERCRAAVRSYAQPRWAAYRGWVDGVKATGCVDCRGPATLFHHVDPATKLFNISKGTNRSAAAVEAELAKCVPLCDMCHRARHRELEKV